MRFTDVGVLAQRRAIFKTYPAKLYLSKLKPTSDLVLTSPLIGYTFASPFNSEWVGDVICPAGQGV